MVDAENQCLGRLATEVASVLRGKNKPTYTPHPDTGDFVVVINADKVKVTGNKASDKLYRRHRSPGGMKVETLPPCNSAFPAHRGEGHQGHASTTLGRCCSAS